MADKIVKAFEALRSHYLQESTQAVNLAQKSVGVVEGVESASPNPKYFIFGCLFTTVYFLLFTFCFCGIFKLFSFCFSVCCF